MYCYILNTSLLVAILLFIICYYYAKKCRKQKILAHCHLSSCAVFLSGLQLSELMIKLLMESF